MNNFKARRSATGKSGLQKLYDDVGFICLVDELEIPLSGVAGIPDQIPAQ